MRLTIGHFEISFFFYIRPRFLVVVIRKLKDLSSSNLYSL